MSAKWFLLSRQFLFAVYVHFGAFSTLTHTVMAQNNTTAIGDRLALLSIKSMIIDDPQGVMTSWNDSTTDFCQWQGVTCGRRHQRVTVLDLSSGGLIGPLSPSIGNLSNLRNIQLSNNSFSGEIPPEIGRLSRLLVLDLFYNSFTGNIPAAIMNCSRLKFLLLDHNYLAGKMQGNFLAIRAKLLVLSLSSNRFWGELPSLSNSSSLGVLDLSNNFFKGSLHNMVCSNGVNKTKYFNLGNNYLSGVIPECWEKWSSLILLHLENNNLSGEIPRTLGSIPSLQWLNMHGNKISGALPSSLMNLSYLKILQLGRNNLVGSIPAWIGIKLTLLKILNFRSNNFYGNIPYEICHLSHVQILDMAHNNLSGNIPRCFNNVSVLSGVETNSEVKVSINFDFGTSTVGDSLVIKGREDTYRAFLGLVMLLDLSSNNFFGEIPSELTTLHALKSLNLSRNQLIGRIPDKIGDMKAIESFDLSVNKLSGELPMSLSTLNFLSSFNVSNNNLIGRVPPGTQIQSFNESSFFGNKLCGAPLTNPCVSVEVPNTIIGDLKEDDGSDGADWGLIISIVLGFAIGFWIIFASLIINRSWRIAYFCLLNKMIK